MKQGISQRDERDAGRRAARARRAGKALAKKQPVPVLLPGTKVDWSRQNAKEA
jgi:hypothetical protein